MIRSRKLPDYLLTGTILFLAIGAFQSLIVDVSSPEAIAAGNGGLQVLWIGIYIIVLIRAVHHRHLLLNLVRANKLLFLAPLVALLSTVWSEDPGVTLRRGIAIVATTLFGADLAARYSLRDQLRILGWVLGTVVGLSVLVQILFPGVIPTVDTAYASAWNGAFIQKNDFARVIVLTAIVLVLIIQKTPRKSITTMIVVLAAFALVVATQSKTALVVLAAMLGWLRLLRFFQRRSTAWMVAGIVGVVVVAAVVSIAFDMGQATQMLGRDATLTGRTRIWELSLQSAWHRPILGYGYSAFWNVSPEAFHINHLVHWQVPHAHNGFIEIFLELGIIGLGLVILLYVRALVQGVRYMKDHLDDEQAAWPLAYFTLTLLYQITESTIVAGNTIFWVLFAATICSVSEVSPAWSTDRVRRIPPGLAAPGQPALKECL